MADIIPIWWRLSDGETQFQMRYRRVVCRCGGDGDSGYASEFGSVFFADEDIVNDGLLVEPWKEE